MPTTVAECTANELAGEGARSCTIMLPFPPSTNMLFKNKAGARGRAKTFEYVNWISVAGFELSRQHPPCFEAPVSIDIQLGLPDNRSRDIDNTTKAVLDLLQKHGVIVDDNCKRVPDLRVRVAEDVPAGRAAVTVTEWQGTAA